MHSDGAQCVAVVRFSSCQECVTPAFIRIRAELVGVGDLALDLDAAI